MTRFYIRAEDAERGAIALPPCVEPYCRGGVVQFPEWEGRTEPCFSCTEVPQSGDVLTVVDTCPTCQGSGDETMDSMLAVGVPGGQYPIGPCADCGSGLVVSGYVTVEAWPLIANDEQPTYGSTCYAITPEGLVMWDKEEFLFLRDPIPSPSGAVPGGVALILTPAECPSACYRGVIVDPSSTDEPIGVGPCPVCHDLPTVGSPVPPLTWHGPIGQETT